MPVTLRDKIIEDKNTPLALIVGSNAVSLLLSDKLQQGGCNVVEVDDFPKRGRFDYIFQFGDCKLVNDAFVKHLKVDGKLLFVDTDDEDLENIIPSQQIRILRTGNPKFWHEEDLAGRVLKNIFSQNTPFISDIRKSMPKHLKEKIVQSEKNKKHLPEEIINQLKNVEMNGKKDYQKDDILGYPEKKLVNRVISKKLLIFLLIVFLIILGSTSFFFWYIKSLNNSFLSLNNHLKKTDIQLVRQDLKNIKVKLDTANDIYNLAYKVLFPFRTSSFMVSTGEILASTQKLINQGESMILILENIKYGMQKSSDLSSVNNEVLDQLIANIEILYLTTDSLKEKLTVYDAPFFPKDELLQKLEYVSGDLTNASRMMPVMKKLFFTNSPKTYLLLFQNNMELRPTGGFIGSVGFLTTQKGKILSLEIMDVYTIDGQLKGHVEPPIPIRKYFSQPNWFLRDSNFDPDFAASSVQAQWFLEKIMQKRVDGVIGIDLNLVQNLLMVTGPVSLNDFYNEVISSENLFLKAQTYINQNFFEGSTQKKDFLNSLSRSLQAKLFTDHNISLFNLVKVLKSSLDQKDLLIFVNDGKLQTEIETLGWAGRLVNVKCFQYENNCLPDYLSIIESNFGVNKANFFVTKSIVIQKKINDKGEIFSEVTLSYENKNIPQIPQGGTYVNYLRLFVPLNSKLATASFNNNLIPSSEIDITSYQNDKIVFGLLVKIPVEGKGVIKISYQLPTPLLPEINNYQFYFQKQAGDKISPLILSITMPDNFHYKPVNFQSTSLSESELYYATDNTVDRVITTVKK